MCEYIIADCVSLGEVVPGVYLIRARGKGWEMNPGDWGLVFSNDPFMVWSKFPVDKEDKEQDIKIWEDYLFDFIDNSYLRAYEGKKLIECCERAGYNEITNSSDVEEWLAQKIYEHISNLDSKSYSLEEINEH